MCLTWKTIKHTFSLKEKQLLVVTFIMWQVATIWEQLVWIYMHSLWWARITQPTISCFRAKTVDFFRATPFYWHALGGSIITRKSISFGLSCQGLCVCFRWKCCGEAGYSDVTNTCYFSFDIQNGELLRSAFWVRWLSNEQRFGTVLGFPAICVYL